MYEIGIGVIAGLIATFLSLVVSMAWLRIILPWYEERVYSDARLEGRWRARLSYDAVQSEELWEIKRASHRTFGQITALDGEDKGNTWSFEGSFKNLLMTGAYTSTNPASIDRGTFTFMLVNNGNTLKGMSSAYYDPENRVRGIEYHIDRETAG